MSAQGALNPERIQRMHELLESALAPTALEIVDQSHLHAGHAGAATGRGHFDLTIRAASFAGKTPIQRHRMVFEALGDMMQTDIHALSIRAETP